MVRSVSQCVRGHERFKDATEVPESFAVFLELSLFQEPDCSAHSGLQIGLEG